MSKFDAPIKEDGFQDIPDWKAAEDNLRSDGLHPEATLIKLMAREIEATEQRIAALIEAGDCLSFMAQTSGGTAGRDDGLVKAIENWDRVRGYRGDSDE